ncbi:hypothetical protein QC761_0034570 [Podospora bellae-mahoneyi]|uniref:Uncharacterized protein n=1 Tax=Podospora bellae-mahoneyi TaxID=2093777 RepID=A0ABR0FPJ0_9PEZI|nr:hypothetical protein QC761_0034570 [Podospora bellae-mahoneyi]
MTDGVVATFQKQCAVVPGDTNGWILSGKPARDSCDKARTSSKEEGNRGRLAVADRALETGKGAVAVMEAAKIHGMEATGADSLLTSSKCLGVQPKLYVMYVHVRPATNQDPSPLLHKENCFLSSLPRSPPAVRLLRQRWSGVGSAMDASALVRA